MPESTNKQGQGKSGDRIALALSGGGSRAIAYHLGCLRALHDFDLLREVRVISTVSGGSVIGALYAYQNQPFEEFDGQVCDLLRRGLLWAIIGPHSPSQAFALIACDFTNFGAGGKDCTRGIRSWENGNWGYKSVGSHGTRASN